MTIDPTNRKLILVDWGYLMFRAIFSGYRERTVKPTYTVTAMLIGNLKKIGLSPEDTVIIAVDSPEGSWRKDFDPAYKAGRKEMREKLDIDWDYMFTIFHELVAQLEMYTPFHVINLVRLEADDIIAYSCKKFQNDYANIVVMSADTDYEQLFIYPNVKIFSPLSKHYKKPVDPYSVLEKKIEKEPNDNLISPVLSVQDYERRNKIVNLMTLPDDVEQKVDNALTMLPEKDWTYDRLPFPSLQDRFKTIYNKDKIVDPNKEKRKRKKGGDKKEWETKAKRKRKKVESVQNKLI